VNPAAEALRAYLEHFYGKDYCLSAESSIDLHLGKTTIPQQVIAMASQGRGKPVPLPFSTSLLIYADPARIPTEKEEVRGIQVMSLPLALCRTTPSFFSFQPKNAEVALRMVSTPSDFIRILLQENLKAAAGRIIGAYQFLKNDQMAKEIKEGLESVGFFVQVENPFTIPHPLITHLETRSSIAAQIFALWNGYRKDVIAQFPKPPGLPKNKDAYLKLIQDKYAQDAYNSLSIEGYRVSKELVKQVSDNHWNPDQNQEDKNSRDALAARGYYEAFQEVRQSVQKILQKAAPGDVLKEDLARWYQKLFAPAAQVGIISPQDLFGYRRGQVYIRNSRHAPPAKETLVDAMEAFFKCVKDEEHPAVRAVLGHFVFVYIHPYMDGNGRIGRFIMNAMLASGGYPWTIIHVENRDRYFAALEKASIEESIVPFTQFIKSELEA